MPKYTFIINGQNFKMKFDDNVQCSGFFTTRRVEEKDVEIAEKLALDSIRTELEGLVLNDRDDPPMLYTDQIFEVESFEGEPVPGEGFTWYDEKEEEEV